MSNLRQWANLRQSKTNRTQCLVFLRKHLCSGADGRLIFHKLFKRALALIFPLDSVCVCKTTTACLPNNIYTRVTVHSLPPPLWECVHFKHSSQKYRNCFFHTQHSNRSLFDSTTSHWGIERPSTCIKKKVLSAWRIVSSRGLLVKCVEIMNFHVPGKLHLKVKLII